MHKLTLFPVLVLCCSSRAALGAPAAPQAQPTPTARESAQEPEAEAVPAALGSEWRGPLLSRNQTPLALLFGYLPPEDGRTLGKGRFDFDLAFDYSNIILDQSSDVESVRLDLEYARTELSLRRGFGRGVELGVSVPFYAYFGGFLDPFVSGFHDTLGLPNFLRGQTENGLVEYRYSRNGVDVFEGKDPISSLGDISIHAKKTLITEGPTAIAARMLLKLPTGSIDELSGSGATDFGFGFALDRKGERFGLFANASYHILGEPDALPVKNYFAVMIGADWRFKPRLAAVIQFDHVRPPLEGELPLLKNGAQQLALGLRFGQSDRVAYEWRFVEDLSSFSPDFTIGFNVSLRFGPMKGKMK